MDLDKAKAKQLLLERFVITGVRNSYSFNRVVIDTGMNKNIVNALCKEMADEGYLDKSNTEASLTDAGYVFFHSGGYGSFFEDLPKNHPAKKVRKITTITILVFLWNTITKNPLISAIVAMIIGTLILKWCSII